MEYENCLKDEPLPLSQLRSRVSAKTFAWLQQAEYEERNHREALEQDEALTSASFFAHDEDDWHEAIKRVSEWKSSLVNPDGIGGYDDLTGTEAETAPEKDDSADAALVKVKYVLSEASGGHGETIWAAARHVSNLFADADKCRMLLQPCFTSQYAESKKVTTAERNHPLIGMRFLELGGGGGIPSWTAMRCGAKVVCTDQSIPERIRCLAESAERNRCDMIEKLSLKDDAMLASHAEVVRVCPYDWGKPVEEVICVLDGTKAKFDIVVAADCIYMPDFHAALLDSISLVMSERGIALLPFALHGNTKDDEVWGIVDLAKEKGFNMDVLKAHQLTPQCNTMDAKRGLVHNLRLTFNPK